MKRNKLISLIAIVAFVCFFSVPSANAVQLDLTLEELSQLLGGAEILGGTTNYDSLALENDGTIYFNNGTGSYGIRDNSGTIQYKNEGGSWQNVGNTQVAGGGWTANALNLAIYPTTNAQGVNYPVILGGTATTSAWVSTDELFINGSFTSTGAANIDGALSLAGAATLASTLAVTGATTLTGDVTMTNASSTRITASGNVDIGGTLEVTGATTLTGAATLSSTLAVTGASTLTGDVAMTNASSTINSVATLLYVGGANGLVLSDGSILDSSGAISFGDENLTTTGTLTADNTTINGSFVANEASEAVDFRVETDGAEYAFMCDSTNDSCGFGTSTPSGEVAVFADGFLVTDSTSPYDHLIRGYDSSDDGVLDLLANNSTTIQLHGNGTTYFNGGSVAIGTTTTAVSKVSIVSTSRQLTLGYDDSNDVTYTVSSGGDLTVAASGGDISFGDENITTTGILTATNASSTQLTNSGLAWFNGNTAVDGGTFIFNDSSADTDFRFEGNGEDYLLFGDAGNDRIGIATSSPAHELDVYGTGTSTIAVDGVTAGSIQITETDGTPSCCFLPAGATALVCAAGACD